MITSSIAVVGELPEQGPAAMSREARAVAVREDLRQALHEDDRVQLRTAELLHEIHVREYWREWSYASFREFVGCEFPFGLRKAELLIGIYKKLVSELDVAPERLRRLKWSKLALVMSAITRDNVEEMLTAVERLSSAELRRKVRRKAASPTVIRPIGSSAPKPSDVQAPTTTPTTTPTAAPAAGPAYDWKRPKPPEHEFYVAPEVWEQACYAVHHGKSMLFKGPSGSGKSEFCYLLARAFGLTIEPFNFGAMSEARSALIGNTHFNRGKGTWFQESRFIRAVTTPGTLVLLDEISRAQREAFNILLTIMDTQGYLSLDESEETPRVRRAPGVVFLGTANLGLEYTGADQLDNALAQRFPIHVPMEFPPQDKEAAILEARCRNLKKENAQRLLRFAARQREMAREGEFVTTVSTRMLIEAGYQSAAGVSLENTIRFCVLNHFPDEGGDMSERTKLLQIFQKG